MSITGDSPALRPLSIGEIFDRAVTLYVRHFVLFTLIMLVVVVPVTVASDYATFGNPAYQQILQQATHPPPFGDDAKVPAGIGAANCRSRTLARFPRSTSA